MQDDSIEVIEKFGRKPVPANPDDLPDSERDQVTDASVGSFPASDPPSFNPGPATIPPAGNPDGEPEQFPVTPEPTQPGAPEPFPPPDLENGHGELQTRKGPLPPQPPSGDGAG